MHRRELLKGFLVLGACPLCARLAFAAEGEHWSYEGEAGPDHWGGLAKENAACSAGSQQSPLDIVGATEAEIPELKPSWLTGGGKIVNNGHTIQLNVPPGSTLTAGGDVYDLVQFHFHAPSEHLVGGRHFPMEVHFVHRKQGNGGLGVVGVFFDAGEPNAAFAAIAGAFPPGHEEEAEAPEGADPNGLLPQSLKYWKYEGSLTTPPCSEVVDWMVLTDPIKVAQADVDKFTAFFPMNARPAQPANRRFILVSG
jgi:carbonic anhydrase